jgi:Eco57I restriction-modification methylase/TaqI-like C-terminal specificity domain
LLFQDVFENGGFDIVIANPPYVRHELIKEQKPLLEAEGYDTYTGTSDLFVYFYECAIELLKPNGVLTFITSNKFYRAGYGEPLRVHLGKKLTLHTLIDFRDAPVFNGVIAYASILIGQNKIAPADHQVAALPWDQEKPAAALPVEIAKAFPVAQSALTSDGWRLVSPATEALLAKLRQTGTPLGEYVHGRLYYGIKTGFNEAFVIDGKKRAELIAADPKSEEIIKPFLRGRDVKRWQATHADLYLIKIGSSANVAHPWKGAKKPWDKFCETYPAVGAFFESLKQIKDVKGVTHWQRLKDRDDQGVYFWELRSCVYWQEFEEPKILYQEIATFQAFALDSSGALSNNKTFLIPSAEPFFLPLLNSKIIWWFLGQIATKMVGDAFAMQSPYVLQIPIPPATAEEKSSLATLAEQCAAATAAGDQETLAAREHQINQLVYRLFHLTPSEIAMIEGATGASPAVGAPASNQGEVYPPALKGHVWNSLKRLAKKHAYVSLNAVKSDLAKTSSEKPGDKTLLKALSEAMAEGIVHDAGRGWYSGIPTPASLDPSHIRELEDLLAKRFPFLPHYLWSTLQLNPWMHHLAGKGIQFLHIDADGEQDAADFLRSAGWNVLVNPTSKTADRLVPGPKSLVLRTVRREIDGDSPPTVATVLVDALLENGRLKFMDEVERKEMTRRLMQEKRIDFAALHSRLKNHKKTIESLIGIEKSGIISEF